MKTKTVKLETRMNFVTMAIVFAIFFNKRAEVG